MAERKAERPLKVCRTCRYWTPKLKGYCDRLQQGAGKFHICEDWSDAVAETEDLILTKAQKAARRS
jgi:hypothetical protein